MIFVIYSGPKGHAPSVWFAGNLEASDSMQLFNCPGSFYAVRMPRTVQVERPDEESLRLRTLEMKDAGRPLMPWF